MQQVVHHLIDTYVKRWYTDFILNSSLNVEEVTRKSFDDERDTHCVTRNNVERWRKYKYSKYTYIRVT